MLGANVRVETDDFLYGLRSGDVLLPRSTLVCVVLGGGVFS